MHSNSQHQHQHQHQQPNIIAEGNEQGDLKRLVHPELHIDEFRSKMGRDADVCVLSFKVKGKEPASDLASFVEKGYDFVIDADVSSGEMDDGDYLVFIEVERNRDLAEHIESIITDMLKLTDQDINDWKFRYHQSSKYDPINVDILTNVVPLTSQDYEKRFGKKEIDDLKTAAGLKVDTTAPKNAHTESLRIAAGIV